MTAGLPSFVKSQTLLLYRLRRPFIGLRQQEFLYGK